MKIEEKDLDLMEKYLEGKLRGPDYLEFQRKLESDSNFKEAFEELDTMVSGIKYSGRRNIKKQIEELEHTLPAVKLSGDTKVIPLSRYKSWIAAAAAFLLIAVGSWWLLIGNFAGQGNLYQSYYQPYANVEHATTRSTESMTIREQAYAAYDREQYQQAINFFRSIPTAEQRPVDDFYTALSYLAEDIPEPAELLLEAYLSNDETVLQDQARWYLALAKLGLGKDEESGVILEAIVENKSYNYHKAESLLIDLH